MKFENVKLESKRALTHDSAELVFDKKMDFTPGQYVTVKALINGEEIHRSYSISSAIGDKVAVGVKRVENGKMSNFLNDIREGTSLELSKAEGRFVAKDGISSLVLVAAGSGITPMMSIIKDAQNKGVSVKLIYLNKTQNDVMFGDELNNLLSGDSYIKVYSREEVSGAYQGRLNEAVLNEILANHKLADADQVMLCGPKGMIDDASEAFRKNGVNPDSITFELFFVDPSDAKVNTVESATFDGDGSLELVLDEDSHTISISKGETILDAALREGVDAPYSCQGGVCSSCMCQVEEGSVEMRQNFTLTDGEVEDGMVLACQAEVKSGKVKVTFDI